MSRRHMLTTLRQRGAREGIVLKTFKLPVPPQSLGELAELFEKNITSRTKLILMCHIVNITGQIFPVKQVVQMARRRGIPVVVDGAHAFAHFCYKRDDLDCDIVVLRQVRHDGEIFLFHGPYLIACVRWRGAAR